MEVAAIVEVAVIEEVAVDAPGEAIFTEIGFSRLNISIIKISILRVHLIFYISCSLWIVLP